MSAIVILGLKVPFKALWKKVGYKERAACSCPGTPTEYSYCPYCGLRKFNRKIKIYESLITGEENVYRDVNTIIERLHENNVDIYDTNPRGYTDDPVYLYFTNPPCFLKVAQTEPMSMGALQSYPYELEDWLREIVGDQIWASGQFGLWAFMEDAVAEPAVPAKEADKVSSGENTRTFIIPIRPDDFQ